jgi:hypothetical protein
MQWDNLLADEERRRSTGYLEGCIVLSTCLMQWDNLLAGEGGREEHRLRGKLHLTVSKGPSALLQDELRMRGNSAPAAAHDPDKG